jgi:Sulfotransferase family
VSLREQSANTTSSAAPAPAAVPWPDRFAAAVHAAWPGLGPALATLESRTVEIDERTPIRAPLYICGLARAGTTVLLELFSTLPAFACHRYADFPGLWTPYWWNRLRASLPRAPSTPVERAHRDRLQVTRESPEAFEEVLWMRFFPGLHRESRSEVFESDQHHPTFERHYRAHIAKLVAVRGAQRYLAKGNYNLTRMGYLAGLFPDARFIVPFRDPLGHIGSLMRQDRWFSRAGRESASVRRHLGRVGHFEFGLDKCPIHVGDDVAWRDIGEAWRGSAPLQGWIALWNSVYGWLADRLERDDSLRARCALVSYNQLCAAPEPALRALADHAGVDPPRIEHWVAQHSPTLSAPDYYRPDFDAEETVAIVNATRAVHERLLQLAQGGR